MEENNSKENNKNNRNLHVFIHAYTTPRGIDILDNQLKRIVSAGLYDAAKSIMICAVGEDIVFDEDSVSDDGKVKCTYSPNTKLYEGFTLREVYAKACVSNPKDCILYIHTKGASYGDRPNEWAAVDSWREHMMSVVVDRWQECVQELEKHSTCGAYGHRNPEPFYAGNFWWARAGYIAKLMPPDNWAANVVSRGGQVRWSYETFIIQGNMSGHKFMTTWPY